MSSLIKELKLLAENSEQMRLLRQSVNQLNKTLESFLEHEKTDNYQDQLREIEKENGIKRIL